MPETSTLKEIQPGHRVRVLSLSGDGDTKKRLTEMGLTKGAEVEVERIAPLGDPIDLKIRGYRLSIRKDEAATVTVEEL